MDIISIMIIAFIIMMGLMSYIFIYAYLKPVIPYAMAKFSGKDLAIYMDNNNRMKMIPVKFSSGAMKFEKGRRGSEDHLILNWFIESVPKTHTFALGDVRAALVHAEWAKAMDPTMNAAIEVLQENGYKTRREFMAGVQAGELNGDSEVAVASVHVVPIANILSYVTPVKPAAIAAQVEEAKAKDAENYAIRLEKAMKRLQPTGGGLGGAGTWITIIMIIGIVLVGYYALSSGMLNGIHL